MESYQNSNRSFEGFETWVNALKMKYKMHTRIMALLTLLFLLLCGSNLAFSYSNQTDIAMRWSIAKCLQGTWPGFKLSFINQDGTKAITDAGTIAATPWVAAVAKKELGRLGMNFLKLFIAVFLFYPLILALFKRRSIEQADSQYIRGACTIATCSRFEYFQGGH